MREGGDVYEEAVTYIYLLYNHFLLYGLIYVRQNKTLTCVMHNHTGNQWSFQQLQCVDHFEPVQGKQLIKTGSTARKRDLFPHYDFNPLFPLSSITLITDLTFSRRVAHHGPAWKFSLHSTSATGGWEELRHSWMCYTQVCGSYVKISTAELLKVKGIQLLLISSWRFQLPLEVLNLDPAFKTVTPLVLEQRYHLQEFPVQSIFGFLLHCQDIWQAGQGCQESAGTFGIVYTEWIGWHW